MRLPRHFVPRNDTVKNVIANGVKQSRKNKCILFLMRLPRHFVPCNDTDLL